MQPRSTRRRVLKLKESAGAAHTAPVVPQRPPQPDQAGPDQRLDTAVNGLRRARPDLSAAETMSTWQVCTLYVSIAVLMTGCIAAPATTVAVLLIALAIPFACVVAMRLAALLLVARNRGTDGTCATPDPRFPDDRLPVYTLIVPLFREAQMVPGLLEALKAIDYPDNRLDILFALEAVDTATIAAFQSQALPGHMRVIIVPDGAPRTKPRAANYALTYARGEYVVVYDAEDIPEPSQLRLAVSGFAAGPTNLGCQQARLNIDNAADSWLTRQFAIEYTALFDCILPMLQHFDLPVPLGGTSNHFPRKVLEDLGGWDPYNVTEDADLGIRLARAGYVVTVLPSTTWEEAPSTPGAWIGQRTRWLKGWMQTYLVHMRRPRALLSDLGARRFGGLQVLMGGMILSAIVHPWFYVLLAIDAFAPEPFTRPLLDAHQWVFAVGLCNLVAGYLATMALGMIGIVRRGRANLVWSCLAMPIYWLAISYAAYRALYQLATAPHYWEKTSHRAHAARAASHT